MTETTYCPICLAELEPCDDSPLYGKSWLHPDNDCEWSEKLVFESQFNEYVKKRKRICVSRHEAYDLLMAHGIADQIMPLIDMLIEASKRDKLTIEQITNDNRQLMEQINKPRPPKLEV